MGVGGDSRQPDRPLKSRGRQEVSRSSSLQGYMHRAKDGTTVQACLMRACDFALAGCRAIGPAFRGGGTAADPNDWSERQPAEQPSAGLEHSGRSPFQIAARQEMLL